MKRALKQKKTDACKKAKDAGGLICLEISESTEGSSPIGRNPHGDSSDDDSKESTKMSKHKIGGTLGFPTDASSQKKKTRDTAAMI